MDQVEKSGAKTMVSACSNCRLTMDESKAHWKWDGGLASLVELIAEHLVEKPAS
jgi:Fe-S oxidoreductase